MTIKSVGKFLISMISLVCLLTSCSLSTKYKVFEVGDYDYNSEAKHKMEIEYDTGSHKDQKLVNSKKTIEYNGVAYLCEYSKTIETGGYKGAYDQYFYESGNGIIVDFGINCDTGKMVQYSWYDKDYLKFTKTPILNREECLALAEDYLSGYTDNISQYKLEKEKLHKANDGLGDFYDFTFNRYIDGIKTNDRASIGITVRGTVFSHALHHFGQMNDAVVPTEKDISIIEKNIDEKMNKIYYKSGDAYNFSYKTTDRVLRRMQDGKYALEYTIDVDITPTDSSSHLKCTELVSLIVYLE